MAGNRMDSQVSLWSLFSLTCHLGFAFAEQVRHVCDDASAYSEDLEGGTCLT